MVRRGLRVRRVLIQLPRFERNPGSVGSVRSIQTQPRTPAPAGGPVCMELRRVMIVELNEEVTALSDKVEELGRHL